MKKKRGRERKGEETSGRINKVECGADESVPSLSLSSLSPSSSPLLKVGMLSSLPALVL